MDEAVINGVQDTRDRELSNLIGYRLLGWSVASLWAVAVLILLRVFQQKVPALDSWLLWVSPLLVIRSFAAVIIYRQLKARVNVPPPRVLGRMSLLFGLSDAVLLLCGGVLLYQAGLVTLSSLVLVAMIALACSSLIYMFTPWVALVEIVAVVVPGLVLVHLAGLSLPLELSVVGCFVVAGTFFGVTRFRSMYMRQLQTKLELQDKSARVAESNFIFNEHWNHMSLAAIDWDRDFMIRSWNPAAEKLFGIAAQRAIGQSLDLLFDRETAADIRSRWLHGRDGSVEPAVIRAHDQVPGSGLACWYDTPLFHEDELIGIASFVLDLETVPAVGGERAASSLLDRIATGAGWQSPQAAAEKSVESGAFERHAASRG